MVKIMMFAHGGSLNRGCEAIVASSSKMIKERIEGARIFLASQCPETDTKIKDIDEIFDSSPMPIEPTLFNKIICSLELKFLEKEHYALGKVYSRLISRIKDADIFLSVGGDNYCYGDQPWLYEIDRRIRKEKKKLVLWACSIGSEDLTDKMLEDLRQFDLILARESLTYEVLKEAGLQNVSLYADPAFTLEKKELPLPEGWKQGDTIGINLSMLLVERNPAAVEAVKKLIEHILASTDSTIMLTPHVMVKGNNDHELLEKYYKVYQSTGRVLQLPENLSAMAYKGYIARMRAFIGARTHATIAAYSSYVPTMVLGYSIKSRGIAKDLFGKEKWVLGADQLSQPENLLTAFDELMAKQQEVRRILEQNVPGIREKAYGLTDALKAL